VGRDRILAAMGDALAQHGSAELRAAIEDARGWALAPLSSCERPFELPNSLAEAA
jgi:hypothetical protein